jgi:UDP-N-acetylmuramyl tripeptide synthase
MVRFGDHLLIGYAGNPDALQALLVAAHLDGLVAL